MKKMFTIQQIVPHPIFSSLNKSKKSQNLLIFLVLIVLIAAGCDTGGTGPDAGRHSCVGDWEIVVNPTCDTKGKETRECEDITCGTIQTRDVAAKGHGSDCPHEYCVTHSKWDCNETHNVVSHNHTFPAWTDAHIITQPNCTTPGLRIRECTDVNCNAQNENNIAVVSTAHNWGSWATTTQPTCTTTGQQTRTCTHNSAHKETQNAPAALGHKPGNANCEHTYCASPNHGWHVGTTCPSTEHQKLCTVGYIGQPSHCFEQSVIKIENGGGAMISKCASVGCRDYAIHEMDARAVYYEALWASWLNRNANGLAAGHTAPNPGTVAGHDDYKYYYNTSRYPFVQPGLHPCFSQADHNVAAAACNQEIARVHGH